MTQNLLRMSQDLLRMTQEGLSIHLVYLGFTQPEGPQILLRIFFEYLGFSYMSQDLLRLYLVCLGLAVVCSFCSRNSNAFIWNPEPLCVLGTYWYRSVHHMLWYCTTLFCSVRVRTFFTKYVPVRTIYSMYVPSTYFRIQYVLGTYRVQKS